MEAHPTKQPEQPDFSHFEQGIGIPLGSLAKELERNRFVDIHLGEYYSDWAKSDEHRQKVIDAIDQALTALDITPANVESTFVKGEYHNKHIQFENLGLSEDVTIGMALFEAAAWDLAIESEEDGPGAAYFTFRVGDGVQINVVGSGDFWTDRSYTDPSTGVIKWSGDLSEDEQLRLSDNDTIVTDAEVNFNLRFECRLEYEDR